MGTAIRMKARPKRNFLRNQRGQMALFIVLIFEVLFAFFAMVINVGLSVHDKINLQNAVDLGAYYAASKQAEVLNEIAHLNYQIRQDYKLLTWRHRVLGTMGEGYQLTMPGGGTAYIKTHPSNSRYVGPENETGFKWNQVPVAGIPNTEEPVICIVNSLWHSSKKVYPPDAPDDVCNINLASATPALPQIQVQAGGGSLVFGIIQDMQNAKNAVDSLAVQLANKAPEFSYLNWWFGATSMMAYREAAGSRKMIVRQLAKKLSAATNDFTDLENQSVREGVLKTIKKNLTAGNLKSFRDSDVKILNSMGSPNCAVEQDGSPRWLSEIMIDPLLLYRHVYTQGYLGSSYFFRALPITGGSPALSGTSLMHTNLDAANALSQYLVDGLPARNRLHAIRGFEKNPWCMAYVGVFAKTSPSKPFAPKSTSPVFIARSFAMPFGGRIGPWDKTKWNLGSDHSDSGDEIDPLAVPRSLNGSFPNRQGPDAPRFFPNYSRFPGDKLGLKSHQALAVFRGASQQGSQALEPIWWAHFFNSGTVSGDFLAFDETSPPNLPPPNIRRIEQAAVAPDLFDVMYYSIEPRYFHSYGKYNATGRINLSNEDFKVIPYDLGHREGFPAYSQVRDQTEVASTILDLAKAFWMIRNPAQVLTSWAQTEPNSYDSIPSNFGNCALRPPAPVPGDNFRFANPGNCVVGGRTGYSVRLVSLDYLLGQHKGLGGPGTSGAILNSPTPENTW